MAIADDLYGEGREQIHVGLMQAVEDVVVEVHPAHSVSGAVVIAGGDGPCPEGQVELHDKRSSHLVSAIVGDDGLVTLRGLLATLDGSDGYGVTITCPGFVSAPSYARVIVGEQDIEGLVWEVDHGLSIRGDIVDAAGTPLAGYRVYATPEHGPDDDPRAQVTAGESERTGADGRFELHGLLAGGYSLSAFARAQGMLEQPVLVELSQAADAEGVRLVVPASGALVGDVRDASGQAVAGVRVEATRLDGVGGGSVYTGDDGHFTFVALNVGDYRVSAREGWQQSLRAAPRQLHPGRRRARGHRQHPGRAGRG